MSHNIEPALDMLFSSVSDYVLRTHHPKNIPQIDSRLSQYKIRNLSIKTGNLLPLMFRKLFENPKIQDILNLKQVSFYLSIYFLTFGKNSLM
jgi:hypothetical protein